MPTEVTGGTGGRGTSIIPGPQGARFVALGLEWTLVADATVAPADTPAADELRALRDAGGRRFYWHYDATGAAWVGWEATA